MSSVREKEYRPESKTIFEFREGESFSEYSHLEIMDEFLDIEDFNFHVTKMEIYTGDDDYNETDCLVVTEKLGSLEAQQRVFPKTRKSKNRIRHELGVRIFLMSENGHLYCLDICHHKGTLVFQVEKLFSNLDAQFEQELSKPNT